MKPASIVSIIAIFCCLLPAQQPPMPATVARQVYVLPMGYGLDQFLANQLAASGLVAVVTDIQKADAVLTDRIGPAFEQQLEMLGWKTEETKSPASTKEQEEQTQNPAPVSRESRPISSFGRGRGTVFLVDLKTRRILWSTFVEIEDTSPKELNRLASRIVQRMKEQLSTSQAAVQP